MSAKIKLQNPEPRGTHHHWGPATEELFEYLDVLNHDVLDHGVLNQLTKSQIVVCCTKHHSVDVVC